MQNVVVVGLGYVGNPLAHSIAKIGFRLVGVDSSQAKVSSFLKSVQHSSFDFDSEVSAHTSYQLALNDDIDIIIFCLPTPLLRGMPDYSILFEEFKKTHVMLPKKALIIIESTVGTSFTRSITKYFPKNDLAFSPERIDPLNKKWDVKNTPKLVAGLTDKARDRAVEFYSKFIDTVIPCSSLEVAETAKLLENSFRLINISFIISIPSSIPSKSLSGAKHCDC